MAKRRQHVGWEVKRRAGQAGWVTALDFAMITEVR
jgi:hypothetical protein